MSEDAAETPPPTPEELPVEVHHKPKPIHGWREFLAEYAIIVLGVLTALAAEQSVEWLHWQGEVSAARKAITEEIRGNNARFFAWRVAIASCMDRQAQETAQALDALEAERKPTSFTSFHVVTGTLLNDNEWQSERAAQTLVHFPRNELALLGSYYGQMEIFTPWMEEEMNAWQEVSVMTNPPKGVGAADILRMRVALGKAQRLEQLIVLNSQREITRAKQLGIADPALNEPLVHKFCTSNDQEYFDAVRAREPRL